MEIVKDDGAHGVTRPTQPTIRNPNAALETGERTRLACRFGRRARTIVGQIGLLTGFRRDAENGNRDGRAPHSDSNVAASRQSAAIVKEF
jgi:hypothetical protein